MKVIVLLFWLQLINASFYRTLADQNRIRLVSNPPIRGRIIDANGNLLADNKLRFSLILQPHLINKRTWPQLSRRLSELLDFNFDTLQDSFQRGMKNHDFRLDDLF